MTNPLLGPVKAALQHMANGQYMHAQFLLKAALDMLEKKDETTTNQN
jgi:hypothetical protein